MEVTILLQKKGKKTCFSPCLQSHCIQLQEKPGGEGGGVVVDIYETKHMHDEPDPGSNIVTSSKYQR